MALNFLNNGYFAGKVGIGTASPGEKLEVAGTIKSISTGAAHLILNGDTNNSGDSGQVDAIIDFLGDGDPGIYGYRINTENYQGQTALNFQEYLNGTYSSRLYINKDGNVGIGTTSPRGKLDIVGNTDDDTDFLTIQDNDPSAGSHRPSIRFRSDTAQIGQILGLDNSMRFSVGTTEDSLLEIASGGNVGIGVTGPNAKLEVSYTNTGIGAIVGNTTHNSQLQIYTAAAGKNSEIWFGDSADDNVGKIDYDHPIDAMLFTTNATEKMRITSGGNVGIGTTSPQSKLHIADSTLSLLKVQETSGNTGASAGALFKTSPNTGNSYFKGGILYEDTGNANVIGKLHLVNRVSADTTNADVGDAKLTIDTVGNVGIGTTSPTTKLHVVGIAQIVESGNTAFYGGDYVRMFGTQSYRFRNTSGTTVAQISLTGNSYFNGGNVGIGTTAPSQKLHVAGNMRLQNQLYDSTNSIGFNGQVLTKTSAGTIWADNRGSTPTTPGGIVATIVGETIEIAFNQSTTSNIDYYQVWSSDDAGDYGIIGQIAPADFSSTMTVVDTTFVTGGTMSYRVYAVKSGVYSTAGTVSKAYTVSALSVTDMTVVNLNTAYYIQYEKPTSRFIDHVEIYMDSQTTSAALSRSNATIVYSGQNASYMRNVNTSSNFHQFWVEIVTS